MAQLSQIISRDSVRYLALGLGGLILLAGASYLYGNDKQGDAVSLPVITGSSGDIFYYKEVVDKDSESEEKRTKVYEFYQLGLQIDEKDAFVFRSDPYQSAGTQIHQSSKKDTFLVTTYDDSQHLIEINPFTGDTHELLKVPEGRYLGYADYLEGEDTLAYITAIDDYGRYVDSRLFLRNMATGEERQYVLRVDRGPLYAGFGILKYIPEKNLMYLHETGGDAGEVWSSWYTLDLDSGAVTKLEGLPIYGTWGLAPALIAPDGEHLVYAGFSTTVDPEDIDREDEQFNGCLKYSVGVEKYAPHGGTLMLRNIKTGQEKELYRNLEFERNYCSIVARNIQQIAWVDDEHMAVVTANYILSVSLGGGKPEVLYEQPRTSNDPRVQRPRLWSVELPYLLFEDGSVGYVPTGSILQPASTYTKYVTFFTREG